MSELAIAPLLPDIVPAADADAIVWKGSTTHLGPLTASTPLHEALSNTTSCGLYLLYIGCVGLISKRLATVMDTNLNRCLAEQIFAYQFDWRYPSTYGITLTDIDENPDKIAAIRRMAPYFFFDIIERTHGYFVSVPPIGDLGYVVNLTRHLCGRENKKAIDAWTKRLIERLDELAPRDVYELPVLQEFPTRAAWETAVRAIHGRPLPIEILDVDRELAPADLAPLAAAQLARIDPAQNRLLRPAAELLAAGFVGTPYRATP